MKIYIISSAPILHEIPPHDLYDSFDLVSQGKLQAPLKMEAAEIISNFNFPFDIHSIKTILTAEGGQTFDTAKLIVDAKELQDVEIIQTPNLNGVCFSMNQLIGKEEFLKSYDNAIIKARKEFIINFFNNQLIESRNSVITRMNQLMDQIKEFPNNTLYISHGFYMKLLEIYVNAPEKFNSVDALIEAFEPTKIPYESLHGFYINT